MVGRQLEQETLFFLNREVRLPHLRRAAREHWTLEKVRTYILYLPPRGLLINTVSHQPSASGNSQDLGSSPSQ